MSQYLVATQRLNNYGVTFINRQQLCFMDSSRVTFVIRRR